MIVHGKTDVGRVRVSNQDAFGIINFSDGSLLAIVCDGMGGANAGNVASECAVKGIKEYVERSVRPNMDEVAIEKLLDNAIKSANIEIYDMSLKNSALSGMGTTVVAAFVKDKKAVIAHVGDSRAYVVSDELKQLTRDHSVVQTLVESGRLTPEEARIHPRKNVITRALGTEENVIIDFCECELASGENLLLCTDGLTNFVDSSEIIEIFNSNKEKRIVEVLVARANHNGGGDNITAVNVTI